MTSGVSKKPSTRKKANAQNANQSMTSLGSLTDTTLNMHQDNIDDSRYTGVEQQSVNQSELSIEPTKLQRLDLGSLKKKSEFSNQEYINYQR